MTNPNPWCRRVTAPKLADRPEEGVYNPMRERPDQCLRNMKRLDTPPLKARMRQLSILNCWTLSIVALCLSVATKRSLLAEPGHTGVLLPDGSEFVSWEQPFQP